MQDSNSAKSLIVQLSSLVHHLEKIAGGSVEVRDIETIVAVNNVLKECILAQKRIKLHKANQDMLAGAESCISDADHQRLAAYLNNIKPSLSVSQQRVARLIGHMGADGTISAAAVKDNVFDVFETLKNKLAENSQEVAEIQDLTLQSAEAICEVIRRLIIQESSRL